MRTLPIAELLIADPIQSSIAGMTVDITSAWVPRKPDALHIVWQLHRDECREILEERVQGLRET